MKMIVDVCDHAIVIFDVDPLKQIKSINTLQSMESEHTHTHTVSVISQRKREREREKERERERKKNEE
jgi:hypothetical protein